MEQIKNIEEDIINRFNGQLYTNPNVDALHEVCVLEIPLINKEEKEFIIECINSLVLKITEEKKKQGISITKYTYDYYTDKIQFKLIYSIDLTSEFENDIKIKCYIQDTSQK